MNIDVGFIFLTVFFAAACINIVTIFSQKTAAHIISKAVLMPALAAWYCSRGFSSPAFSLLVLFALGAGWMGDIALAIPSRGAFNKKLFFTGLIFFFIGHIFYIVRFVELVAARHTEASLPLSISCALILIALEAALHFIVRCPRENIIPFGIYGTALAVIVSLAAQIFWQRKDPAGVKLLAGTILFFVSDITLACSTILKRTKVSQTIVMITYILAQFLIVFGLLSAL